MIGFIYGEGCFLIDIRKSKAYKLGYQISLVFQISQHLLDAELMKSLVEYLKAGRLIFRNNHPLVVYVITKFSDIEEIIIPFLQEYALRGVKKLEFEDWCQVATIMKNKGHLTVEGLENIKKIQERMNKRF